MAQQLTGTAALTGHVDRIVTHRWLGLAVFLGVMGGLFWVLFTLAAVPMALLDSTFAWLGGLVRRSLPDGPVRSLLADGLIGGVAGTVVFLPQICLLFLLISLLEDTGYLARAAVVASRFLQRFGLPGQAFVPLLTAHACAVPALMSTRMILERRDRLATILVAPFMSCSARLPVYVLLTSLLFADRPALAGLAFVLCYVLGTGAALASVRLLSCTVLKGHAQPLRVDLPAYRPPSLTKALAIARTQALSFLKTAGTVITAISIAMWWLGAYPRSLPTPESQTLRAQASEAGTAPADLARLRAQADALDLQAQQRGSYAGRLGRAIQPVFAPLGYDSQLVIGIVSSFVAREVFVSTLSVLAGGRGDRGVVASIQTMRRSDGTPVFTRATAASALVFFVLAMQCLSTLTMTRRETGAVRYAALQFAFMSGVAYAAALVVYQGLRFAGVT
jgi:ferrous iron transport protein B